MNQLGKIKIVKDLRSIWANEALDFTNWLAQEENLTELGEELGLEISLIKTEADVGSFNADILAQESRTEEKIIIENQLERSDHEHLGKIITYASGCDAKYIIWIVKEAREEHSQAITWLNENTNENINFFLIKVELWQIGNSAIAPKFQIISRPNEWGKTVKNFAEREAEATQSQNFSYNLWSEFKEYAIQHKVKYNLQSPRKQNWYSISVGSSGVHIELKTATRENSISCQFYILDDHNLYNFLHQYKSEIEAKIGEKLDWNYQAERKASYIGIKKSFDFNNKEEYLSWMFDITNRFYQVFRPYLKKYK